MPRIVAVVNQKAGVGKTTTVASLGAAFAELREQVLMVDLDPQAHLTSSLGINSELLESSVHEVISTKLPLADATVSVSSYLDLVPSTIELTATETKLLTRPGREYVLREGLKTSNVDYDWVLIDCSPSLGLLTHTALTAADDVLIPIHAESLSHRGLRQLFETMQEIRQFTNPGLNALGLLPVMFEGSHEVGRGLLAELERTYSVRVWPAVPFAARFKESMNRGGSILATDTQSPSAMAYRDLARGLIATLPLD